MPLAPKLIQKKNRISPWTVRYEDDEARQRERSFHSREDALAFLRQVTPEPERRPGVVYRDECLIVYRLYDVNDSLIYVGKSRQGPARVFEHYKKPWAYAEYARVADEASMNDVEAQLIHAYHPPLNKMCYTCNRDKRVERAFDLLRTEGVALS